MRLRYDSSLKLKKINVLMYEFKELLEENMHPEYNVQQLADYL